MSKAWKIFFYVLSFLPLLWFLYLKILLFISPFGSWGQFSHFIEQTLFISFYSVLFLGVPAWTVFLVIIKVKKFQIKLLLPILIFITGLLLNVYMFTINFDNWFWTFLDQRTASQRLTVSHGQTTEDKYKINTGQLRINKTQLSPWTISQDKMHRC